MSKPKHPTANHVLGHMLKLIPRYIIHKTDKEAGVDVKARTYSVISHLGTMIFVQLALALNLNDGCNWPECLLVRPRKKSWGLGQWRSHVFFEQPRLSVDAEVLKVGMSKRKLYVAPVML